MGVAVVLQIEQKMEREEIGDMERNKREKRLLREKERGRREIMLRMNIQMFSTTPKIPKKVKT